ncbi:MAG: AI-2E family transporter [Desulfomonilaceae bacterium]
MPSGLIITSYVLAAIAIPIVLWFHLLPVLFSGLAVYVLTIKLARLLPVQWGSLAHKLALTVLVGCVMLALFGAGLSLWSFLDGSGGMAALLSAVADTLERLRASLAPDIGAAIPHSMEDLRQQLNLLLRENAHGISAAGIAGVRILAHVILGMVVGGITAIYHFETPNRLSPLSNALRERIQTLVDAFDKVVFAQVKISALNTALTAFYLLVVLPSFNIHFPMLTVLIAFTFVVGLLPIIGNLVSNTVIVLISLGVSPSVAIASLVFLVAIHKLEYFTNAYIVGGEVQARAWEILCAMIVMEAVFGIAGLIAAPVAYAWLKAELRANDLL